MGREQIQAQEGLERIQSRDQFILTSCEIRKVAIPMPFYTYCANHRVHRPERDPISIGPITRYRWRDHVREVWMPSPDSEEVRRHLLELLEEFSANIAKERYRFRIDLLGVVIWQLGEFREKRAEKRLRWISENSPERWKSAASKALSWIEEGDQSDESTGDPQTPGAK